ncbi:hypothetical protein ACFXKV_06815 [Streptomyces globisporus]|uniref:hypothetical protein n=1 Tax=Streptomyces TaxID=1883 RepID=UPI001F3CBFC5|nr:hypothetical protein [Streptomyces sp. R527F]UIZ15580.1 hypothetical protein LZ559_25940 [Streptomyces sp. R527F]
MTQHATQGEGTALTIPPSLVGVWKARAVEDATGDAEPVDVEIEFGADRIVRLTGPRDEHGEPYFTGRGEWSQDPATEGLFRFALRHPLPGPVPGEARAELDGAFLHGRGFLAKGHTYCHYEDGTVTGPSVITVEGADVSTPVVVLHRWTTSPERQNAVADTLLEAWRRTPAPASPRALTVFVSTNGDTVFGYEQWSSSAELKDFERLGRQAVEGDGAVEGAERSPALVAVPYRSRTVDAGPAGSSATPGCVVITTFGFGSAENARAWADAITVAETAQPEPTPGLLARHFLISGAAADGGVQVLNCSEWSGEDAHRAFLENPVVTPEWQRVEEFTSGITHGPGRRCVPRGTLPTD